MESVNVVKELNDQVLRAWDIYIKFFTVFLTVNIAALGLIVEKTQPGSAARWVVGITFVVQNAIAVITGLEMARYTRRATASLTEMKADALSAFGRLGNWGGVVSTVGVGGHRDRLDQADGFD